MIRTYADGFGTWHAVVPLDEEYPHDVAWNAIAQELRERGNVAPWQLDRYMHTYFVGVSDDGQHGIYAETWED